MKTVLILNNENYYTPHFLYQFLSRTNFKISHIYTTPFFFPQAKKLKYIFTSVIIMGPWFNLKYLFKLFFDRRTIKRVAQTHGIPITWIVDVNSSEFRSELNQKKITIALSLCSQIYAEDILSRTRVKFYNFHPSLLPRNKGRFPIFWAISNGDEEQGITCHEINLHIDDGRILFQNKIKMKKNDNVPAILDRINTLAAEIFEEALQRISKDEYQIINSPADSCYGPTPTLRQILKYHWDLLA